MTSKITIALTSCNRPDELKITFIDIHEKVFSKHQNPLNLFPFGLSGHYNEEGYKKVGNTIGRTQVARSSTRAPSMKSSTVSRGGFGAQARSFGSVAG